MPLIDVTNATNIQRSAKAPTTILPQSAIATIVSTQSLLKSNLPPTSPSRKRHDPYSWQYVADSDVFNDDRTLVDESNRGSAACIITVQHKCHLTECYSGILLKCGQYVVIRGDRGIDIGVVIRVSTDFTHPLPAVGVIRYATQHEVDFWATNLKALEASALEYCRQRVQCHKLAMDVRHAEFQFDQNKLTYYFDARQRVDFVLVLRELYREFGCRIWMEKVS